MQRFSQHEASNLRQKAEDRLKSSRELTDKDHASNPPPEIENLRLIHELEVHQIELEMQNEELVLAKELASIASEKYIELYDFAPTGYFTLSRQARIMQINLMGAKMLGKNRSQLIEKSFTLFVPESSKAPFLHFLETIFQNKTKTVGELPLLTEEYQPRYLYLTGILNEEGDQCYVTATDITERKMLEETQAFLLHISNPGSSINFFESIAKYLSQSLDMEYVCIDKLDADGLTAQTIAVYHDGTFDTNLSYSLKETPCGEVVDKTICCFPSEVCQLFPNDAALSELKAVSYIGTTLTSFDGHPIGLIAVIGRNPLKKQEFAESLLKLVALRAAGELERNLVEQELVTAKEHAEQSDHLKSAFLANMSHEIRTPMNGILGFADLLKEPNLSGEEQQQYIGIIEKSGIRMLNIINDIVNISKIESGLMEVFLSKSNINEQIDFIQTFFKPMAQAKGILLTCKSTLPSNKSIILTDKEKVYGILTNLVKNSIKFTDKGTVEFGYELVAGKNHEFSLKQPQREPFLQFYVKDTGIGIETDRQQVIFDRFIQADIQDIGARQGAGLGLTISKAYAEMLGGRIWVESIKGEGSTFYFTLPYQQAGEAKVDQSNGRSFLVKNEPVTPNTRSIKILIVEDDEISAIFLATILASLHCEVLRVKSGREALNICLNDEGIDLILMDIKMTEMNGYETTRQIREFNSQVIILAQTAFALTGDKEKALEAGCNDYIEKPINRFQLIGLINKYFNKPAL
jgi:signal transduction histidine kinase/CheY-like chemotaxis protein/PAS domain-containing protein